MQININSLDVFFLTAIVIVVAIVIFYKNQKNKNLKKVHAPHMHSSFMASTKKIKTDNGVFSPYDKDSRDPDRFGL